MAIIKCKMCGGDLALTEGSTIAECEYCGAVQTVPTADNEKKLTLFARANRLRAGCEFDKAAGVYESIVADFPEEAEGYWGLVLCKYGIEYVDDPATGKKIPTCHRSSFDSVMDDENFDLTLEYTDAVAKRVYRDEAKVIEEIRKDIIAVSSTEEPYDIFICYKETDDTGSRTLDSVLAQDIYDALTERGYRVFFSRISLEDKLGTAYEPYIFAALNSAKIMLAVGTDYDYYHAVWVKNEWSRYLKLMASDKAKHLIPCYKNIDAYDMPKEFAHLQAQDMGKVGAMQDLLRGIGKILPKDEPKQTVVKETVVSGTANTAPLLKRVFMFLEDSDWSSADEYCEKVLDIDPENAQAYLGKLMAEMHAKTQDALKDCAKPFDDTNNYKKAIRFGDEAFGVTLAGYIEHIKTRNKNELMEKVYINAKHHMDMAKDEPTYKSAAALFANIENYKDATVLRDQCIEKACEARYNLAEATMNTATTESHWKKAAILFEGVSEFKDAAAKHEECLNRAEETRKDTIYADAKAYMEFDQKEYYERAIKEFENISGWRDADEQVAVCEQEIKRIKDEEALAVERRAEQARIEAARKAEQERIEAENRAARKLALSKEKSSLMNELLNLKGLFTGKRRKELETRIAEIDDKLSRL